MKRYNFDEIIERKGTGSIKWDKLFPSDAEKIYPLWVADMDFACSDEIIAALHKRADERVYGYNMGFDAAYRECVCRWFARRFNWSIEPSTIFYSGGIVSAIAYLIAILSEEGDGIVIQTPVYHPFRKKIEAAGRKVVRNSLINTNGYYTMDYDNLEEVLARDDVKGILLCSPHNPSGRVWSEKELQKVVDIARKYQKWIISDEIHCDIIREEVTHTPLLKLASQYADRIIACTAPSKSFNLAGLQNSNIIISNPDYQKRWSDLVTEQFALEEPNSFGLSATFAAYNESEEWLNQVNAYIDENMKEAKKFIEQQLADAIVSPLEGTYMLWVDLNNYTANQDQLEQCLLKKGIIFNQGCIFGDEGSCFVRINVACPKALLMECLTIFIHTIQAL